LLQLAVFLPYVQRIFKVEGNLGWEWAIILGLSLLPVTIIEVLKLLRAWYKQRAVAAGANGCREMSNRRLGVVE